MIEQFDVSAKTMILAEQPFGLFFHNFAINYFE